MRIEYELKFRDYWLFSTIHQFVSIPYQLFLLGMSVFVFYSMRNENNILDHFLIAFAFYLLMCTLQVLFSAFYLCFGKYRTLLTKHIVEIQDDSFYEETQFNKSYYYWHGIEKVVSMPGFISVYINANVAHIIPNRAFANHQQKEEFLENVLNKIKPA